MVPPLTISLKRFHSSAAPSIWRRSWHRHRIGTGTADRTTHDARQEDIFTECVIE